MILLTGKSGARPRRSVFAVFGAGLIGSAIAEALERSVPVQRRLYKLDWKNRDQQDFQLSALEEEIATSLAPRPLEEYEGETETSLLALVWSAGAAGFSATEETVLGELSSFRAVLDSAERLAHRYPTTKVVFLLMSSAGGLFEGQRLVNLASTPSPRRPYGHLKLWQEQLLTSCQAPMVRRIYRLTSVYGHISPHQRQGLIPTLIRNGLCQEISYLTGRMDTLRDFVWVEDIATCVNRDLLQESDSRTDLVTSILASMRPYSLYAVQNLIEEILERKLYVAYSTAGVNSENITFGLSSADSRFAETDISSSIQRIYQRAIGSGILF